MKRTLKTAVASVLCLGMILSVTACSEGGSGGESTTPPPTTTFESYTPLVEHVTTLTDKVDTDIKVEKKIRWLSHWAIDETQAAAELFKYVYGIPENGVESYGEDADKIFDYIYVDYNSRWDRLGTMVSTGDSPDIFQFEIANYPYAAYKKMFQPIDDVIDFSNPLWDPTRDAMEQFKWGGETYCAIVTLNLDQVMWYRRSVVEQAGLKEPYEYYKEGNWNWNTMLEMLDQWQKSGEGKYGLDGWQVPDRLVSTTGVPIIGIVDGKLQDNLYNADIERCMTNVIDVIFKQGYRYPRHELNGWSISVSEWVKGNTLFMCDLTTAYKDTLLPYIERYKWDPSDVFCVPFPKDPEADKYYQVFKNDSFMLCAGAPNVEGFKAWTECLIATAYEEETIKIGREQNKINNKYTDEMLDLFDEMQYGNVLTPVFDFKEGIGVDIVDPNSVYNPVACLTQIPYLNCVDADNNPATFTSLRAANEGTIKNRIDQINAEVSNS